jgi:hypothetical protein
MGKSWLATVHDLGAVHIFAQALRDGKNASHPHYLHGLLF